MILLLLYFNFVGLSGFSLLGKEFINKFINLVLRDFI